MKDQQNAQTGRDSKTLMAFQIRASRLPDPARDCVFSKGGEWMFDFSFQDEKVGIECVSDSLDYWKNKEKYQVARVLGWTVLRFTKGMIESGVALNALLEALGKEKENASWLHSLRLK